MDIEQRFHKKTILDFNGNHIEGNTLPSGRKEIFLLFDSAKIGGTKANSYLSGFLYTSVTHGLSSSDECGIGVPVGHQYPVVTEAIGETIGKKSYREEKQTQAMVYHCVADRLDR